MLKSRWRQVRADLWSNKTRTGLIVLSITAGLFAIGVIVNARAILAEDYATSFAAINPSSGVIRTTETFDQDLVRSVRRMDGVADADGRTYLVMRFRVKQDGARWRDLQLFAAPDYDHMRVNKIWPQSGAWPPPYRELLVERSALEMLGAQVGDSIQVETADRKVRDVRVAGTVHDLCQLPATFADTAYGYISFDTLEWLGERRALNELDIVVRKDADQQETLHILNQVKDKLEKSGNTIPGSLFATPGTVALGDIMQTILMLLGVLGFLSLFLSAFLIVNTIAALVTQQTRQIGIMKAIGARDGQIVGMYLALALAYGLLALLLAAPLGIVGSNAFCQMMAGFFNFDVAGFRVSPETILLQIVIGLLTPLLAALWPVLGVLRITVADAMRNDGLAPTPTLALLEGVRIVSRPTMLSLRNTFRRKGRLALTLITLTLGGAIFIGVFSVRAALARTLGDLTQVYRSDVWINFSHPQRVERVEQQALEVPGVVGAKGWARMPVRRVRPDETESDTLHLIAPPVESNLVRPVILQGRWLFPEDSRALVVSTGALKQEPDIRVGDEVVLKVEGRKTTFQVVGVALGMGMASFVYANYADVARITQDTGQVSALMVVTEQHSAEAQAQAARLLEARFRQAGTRVNSVQLVSAEYAGTESGFNIVIILALVMALLLASVGGLGLTGTLSINVLERTREIGVMRAIGASDGAVAQVFIVEGIVIGVISWLLGTLLALPLSKLLSDAVGEAFLQVPLTYVFSMDGVWLWLTAVVVLSGAASFWPARNATRLTVRDVLAYE